MVAFELIILLVMGAALLNVFIQKPMKDRVMISKVDGSWLVTKCKLENKHGIPVLITSGAGNMLIEPRHPLRLSGGGNLYAIAQRNAEDNVGIGNCEIDLSLLDLDIGDTDGMSQIDIQIKLEKAAMKKLKVKSLVKNYDEVSPVVLEPIPPTVTMQAPVQSLTDDGKPIIDEEGNPVTILGPVSKTLKTAVFAIEPNAAQLKRVLSQIHKDYDPNMYGKDFGKTLGIVIIFIALFIMASPFINEFMAKVF